MGVACLFQLVVMTFKVNQSGFPGGPKDKNLPANSWGHRCEPWSGKIPHAVGQLSSCTITTEDPIHAQQQKKPPQ